ncbi:MAG TPA: hypothetical protein PLO78_08530 [Candidatus Omnitrophota bacterium]|nr:hypothetical protein [Candidatus Omnitrophota bacterium]
MGSRFGIIVAFLLSVAAAGGSYYLYQGWVEERTVREKVEADKDQLKEKILAVQSEKDQFKTQSEEYRDKAQAMQGQLDKLRAEQSRIDTEKANLENQLKSHQSLIVELQKKVEDLAKQAEDAKQACRVSPADMNPTVLTPTGPQPLDSTVPVTATSTPATSDSTALVFKPAPQGNQSVGQTSAPATATSPVAAVLPSETSAPAAPTVATQAPMSSSPASTSTAAAKVLTVNRKFNFVVVNMGLQDGIKMGDQLKVVKGGKEVATLQAEKLYDKFSAATIIQEDSKEQVVEGDEIRKV